MSGAAADRLSRLLALVPWLMAHDGASMADCAAHFGVTEEQLERDLYLLVVCGVPGYGPDQLVDIQFWDDEPIRVLDPQTLAKPLRLSAEEALTLLIALRMLAQVPGVDDREAIVSAAVKLEQAASTADAGRVIAVQVRVDPGIRSVIDVALAQHRELQIRYGSASKDEVTERTIRPRRLFTTDGVSYLEAYCLLAGALRTFRVDRIIEAALGGPAPHELDDQARPVLGEPAADTDRLMALLAVDPEARWIIDVHHGGEVAGSRPDGRTLVTLPLNSHDWAVRLVLSLRGAAVVLEPADLAEAVAGAAAAALTAYPDLQA